MRKRRAVKVFSLLALCISMLASCTGESQFNGPVEAKDISGVKLLSSGKSVPSSAYDVWVYRNSWMDSIQMIRFDAPVSEARTFAVATLGKRLVKGYDARVQNAAPKPEWWLKTLPSNAESGESHFNGPAKRITLVPSGGQARVWLIEFTS